MGPSSIAGAEVGALKTQIEALGRTIRQLPEFVSTPEYCAPPFENKMQASTILRRRARRIEA